MSKPSKREDMEHIRAGYALLKEAIDEFGLVYDKGKVMAHVYRVLGEMEDLLYQVVTDKRRAG